LGDFIMLSCWQEKASGCPQAINPPSFRRGKAARVIINDPSHPILAINAQYFVVRENCSVGLHELAGDLRGDLDVPSTSRVAREITIHSFHGTPQFRYWFRSSGLVPAG
jgi:hypothetical protein